MISANALTVLQSRYLLRDENGMVKETPGELFMRVAVALAKAESRFGGDPGKVAGDFFRMMNELRFLPNSPTLMNAGTPRQQLSACFVLPVEDSLEGIYDTLKHAARIHQSGGGTGFNFSQIRPKNAFLPESGGTASGPVSFMELFDASTERIKQGGKRRGANMAILNCDHPDIQEFIALKKEVTRLRNFNVSVGVTDAFMQAVANRQPWKLVHPSTGKMTREVDAHSLWNEIISCAWKTGDPGIIFLDAVEKTNPTPEQGHINATNPCGEVPLLPYEACNLGSLNLPQFVKTEDGRRSIDLQALGETISLAVRFLDNVIEENDYVLPQIRNTVRGNRKIGLGVMGWAELLIMLGIPYASEEAVALGRKLMRFINEVAKESSFLLSRERGTFPEWAESEYAPAFPLRNATRTAIAPTGTIAVIAGTSPSIEPLFAIAFERQNVLGGVTLTEMNPVVKTLLLEKKLFTAEVEAALQKDGHLENTTLPAELRLLLRTASFIAPEWHLAHQAAFQENTDNAVSKTINLPNSATIADIDAIYRKAWTLNLKGITVFRDGCKPVQVMNAGTSCEICVS